LGAAPSSRGERSPPAENGHQTHPNKGVQSLAGRKGLKKIKPVLKTLGGKGAQHTAGRNTEERGQTCSHEDKNRQGPGIWKTASCRAHRPHRQTFKQGKKVLTWVLQKNVSRGKADQVQTPEPAQMQTPKAGKGRDLRGGQGLDTSAQQLAEKRKPWKGTEEWGGKKSKTTAPLNRNQEKIGEI